MNLAMARQSVTQLLALVLAQNTAAPTGSNESLLVWGFILLGVSLVFLFLEMFVPSGGLIGMLAGVAAIGSVIAFFQYDTTWGLVAAALYLVFGPILIVFVFKLWLNSPLARGMILGGEDPTAIEESDAALHTAEQARQERLAQLRQLIGAQGIAVSQLRPIGTVKINGQRIDALAESGFIDAGGAIVVTEVYDNQVKVRAM